MKKIEFSKLIFITMFLTAITFTALTIYVALMGADTSSISNIVLAIWASVGTGELAYYSKAKAENLLKIGKTASIEELERAAIVKNLGE